MATARVMLSAAKHPTFAGPRSPHPRFARPLPEGEVQHRETDLTLHYGEGAHVRTTFALGEALLPLDGSRVTSTVSGGVASDGLSAMSCATPSASGENVPSEVH